MHLFILNMTVGDLILTGMVFFFVIVVVVIFIVINISSLLSSERAAHPKTHFPAESRTLLREL